MMLMTPSEGSFTKALNEFPLNGDKKVDRIFPYQREKHITVRELREFGFYIPEHIPEDAYTEKESISLNPKPFCAEVNFEGHEISWCFMWKHNTFRFEAHGVTS